MILLLLEPCADLTILFHLKLWMLLLCKLFFPIILGNLLFFTKLILDSVAYSIFLIKIIIDTIYDLYKRSKNEVQNKFWSSFSVYTNGMKLFDITKVKSPNAINSMNGLRVLSIFWIIIGHRIATQFPWGN